MRSLEAVWVRTRAHNKPFPNEFLGSFISNTLICLLRCWIVMNVQCLNFPIVISTPTQHIRLWLQSDNTVKEIRNQYGAKILSCMAQAGLWAVASCHHLQVGHTHEDVDSIFSLVAMALKSSPCLETPMDVAKRIESKLSHLWTSKGLVFSIEIVDTVAWLSLPGLPEIFLFCFPLFSCLSFYLAI